MPSLTSMPELVMNEILKNLDFRQVQTLRKVCRDLRNFIDDNKPDAKLKEIGLEAHNTYIFVVYKNCEKTYHVEYGVRGCTHGIFFEKTLRNQNYVDAFLKDIAIILSFQNSTLNNLSLYQRGNANDNYSKTLGVLTSLRNSRKTLLKTKELIVDVLDEHQMLSVLPCLDSNVLEIIEIRDPHESLSTPIEADQLVTLRHWKKAKEIRVCTKRFSYRLEDFKHLSRVMWFLDRLLVEQVENVKKTFLHSSTTNYFYFYFQNFENEKEYLRSLGRPYETDGNKVWYFRMKDSSEILEITRLYRYKAIIFNRILVSDVPEGSVIQD